MSFFYDLNARMAKLAAKQDAKQITEDVKASAPKSQLAEALEEADYSAKKAAAGKDIGKPGKNFSKIAKSAGEKYGSKAAGERVAGAVLNKLRHPKESGEQHDTQQPKLIRDLKAQGLTDKQIMQKMKELKHGTTKKIADEGNAFTGALAKTPKGDKFKVGSKEFTDTSDLEETMTRQHFRHTADLLKNIEDPAKRKELAHHHAGIFKASNPRFDLAKFLQAAGVVDEADVTGLGEETMDEGYAEMDAWLKSREKEKGTGKFDKKERTLPSGMKATTYTRKPEPEDNDDTEVTTITIKKKGRPAGTKRAIGAKHSGRSKLASKDAIAEEIPVTDRGEYDQEGESAKHDIKTIVRHAQALHKILGDDDNLPEWVQSKLAKIEGMMIAVDEYMQNQDQEVSEKASKVKEEGSKPDFLDMDKDGDKKESMKKAVADKKGKKVDETTTSGSVATAPAAPKASKSMQFGKGVYEGINSKVETMIAESMNVTVNMSTDEQGQAQKSITVTATDEDADKLAELLKMAGLGGHSNQSASCSQCGEAPCGCAEVVDENSPDWPTNTEKLDAQPELRTYSGGLNGPKSTGQTTVPVVASQLRRQTSMEENVELERSLFKLYDHYKAQ
jgi:hypothetical protein